MGVEATSSNKYKQLPVFMQQQGFTVQCHKQNYIKLRFLIMTSNETCTQIENSPAIQPANDDIDSKLANICGPFSWNIRLDNVIKDELIAEKDREEHLEIIMDTMEYFPEFVLTYHLMQTFENVKNGNLSQASQSLSNAEETLADIKKRAMLNKVENVLQHIFVETKYHVLKELGQVTKAMELLKEITRVIDMTEVELATLNGCHSSALLLYRAYNNEGVNCAVKAIKYEPDNGKWHYLLARHLRTNRKKQYLPMVRPSEQEATAFKKAYSLSPNNALFGAGLARLYRESWNESRAAELHEEVYALQPKSCSIRLQLALGFIQLKVCERAKNCLDYVAERMPDCARYNHYMAMFEEKCNRNSEAALPYYKKSTELFNDSAEAQYIKCKKRVERDWDPLPYLLNLSKKYGTHHLYVRQRFDIEIGSYYLYEMNDVLSACPYLSKAIEIKPDSTQLRKHLPYFRHRGPVNLYHTLTREIEHALQIGAKMYSRDQLKILEDTLQLCYKNCKDLPPHPRLSQTQAALSQSTNSPQHHSQGFSWGVKNVSWRNEKPNTVPHSYPSSCPRSNGGALNSPRRISASSERDRTWWRSSPSATVNDNSASGDRGRGKDNREA